jgi:uncharacterized membrane protein
MASYHFMWDLAYFGYVEPSFPATGWPKIYARSIATTFLFLSGLSLVLAYRFGFKPEKFIKRFLMIAAAAALVTIATYFAIPNEFIFFGILHAMAAASLVGLIFLRAPPLVTAAFAILAFFIPRYYQGGVFDQPWMWWAGLATRARSSFDYVPVLPWLCPFLFGMAFTQIAWVRSQLTLKQLGITQSKQWITPFAFLGRHSLVFYLVHQAVLFPLVFAFSYLAPPPKMDPAVSYMHGCRPSCESQRGPAFCQSFCSCTLEELRQKNLLDAFQSGAISMRDDPMIKEMAVECSIRSE